MNKLKPKPLNNQEKIKQLKQLVDQQRRAIAKETNITGKECAGHITKSRDPANNRVLVKDIIVISYRIEVRKVEGEEDVRLGMKGSRLDHAWVDDTIIRPEGEDLVTFLADVEEYERLDGTKSIGFVPLHRLAQISLITAGHLHKLYRREYNLQTSYDIVNALLDQVADALKNDPMASTYFNYDLIEMLLFMYTATQAQYNQVHGIKTKKPKRKKKKGWATP